MPCLDVTHSSCSTMSNASSRAGHALPQSTSAGKNAHSAMRRMRALRRSAIAFGIIAGIFLIIRFGASPIATAVINRKLQSLPDYTGQVGAIHLSVWRGAVAAEDFVLYPRERADNAPPLVQVDHAAIRIALASLLRGRLGGQVHVDGAVLNAVKDRQFGGAGEAAKEAAQEVKEKKPEIRRWQDVLASAFPVEISRLEVRNSKVRFIDRSHDPVVDVSITGIAITATGLRNRRDGEAMPAHVDASGVLTGNGELRTHIDLDPLAKQPTFHIESQVRHLSLPPFNSFMLAYANADVSQGTFEMDLEVDARGGAYDGYIKPFLSDLNFKNPSDEQKNVVQKLGEKMISAVTSLLKSDEDQKVATKAPFHGTFEQTDVDIWTTLRNLLHNAFVQAIKEGLEGHPRAN